MALADAALDSGRPFERSSQGVRALSKLHRSFDFGYAEPLLTPGMTS
jgi:hypothetical protein